MMLPVRAARRAGLRALGRRSRDTIGVFVVRAVSTGFPEKQGLYDPAHEKDSCGVGLVASLKGEQTPDEFMRARVLAELGVELPALGEYAVGQCFLPADEGLAVESRKSMERIARQRGLGVIGWRALKTDNSALGEAPVSTEPRVEQLLLKKPARWDERHFEQELYRLQRYAELEAQQVAAEKQLAEVQQAYICSMSPYLLTFKGQLTPEQVVPYFAGDLAHEDFKTNLALVHSRFSTNTFPSWSRAQPLRMMCHNGEINTLRGNKNWMRARGGLLRSAYYGDATAQLLPVTADNMSDSGNFDSVMQLLANASARSIPEIAMMMVPEAWQDNDSLSEAKKAFYEYNSCLMEPWDGPALIAFTDARRYIGATLDRNGLRPARYYVTEDDRILLSSEVGVLPWVAPKEIKVKSRLEPGKMFLVDLKEGRIVPDNEIKEQIASQQPYGAWLESKRVFLSDWAKDVKPEEQPHDYFSDATVSRRLVMHGYTTETMETLLAPMAIGGKEGLGSMGNDAALAVLSKEPRPVFDFFKQLFAQVTNPPIDPIREELVMSLVCPVGPEANLLEPAPENCAKLVVDHPVLTLEDLAALTSQHGEDWKSTTIDATFLPPAEGWDAQLTRQSSKDPTTALEAALSSLCEQVSAVVQGEFDVNGSSIIVLSDALAGPERLPIPSLLAVGAVHQHLLRTGQRGGVALFVDSGDVREVHDMSLMVGYGADGVCPRVAYEAVSKLRADGFVAAKLRNAINSPDDVPSDAALIMAYRKSLAKGMLKVMSKMGISTLQSYKGAQIFEAVGLNGAVVDMCFGGTPSRIGGAGFEALQRDVMTRHKAAWQGAASSSVLLASSAPNLTNPGQFHYRHGGERHLNTPNSMVHLQAAARNNSREAFKLYSKEVNASNAACTLRGMLRWKPQAVADGAAKKLTLEDVEPTADIVKRFVTGAMSLGSISQETHEALAVAMNKIGGRSNTGEGGEDPVRFTDNRRSAIKQVASGRFGVTSHYLANSDQIQIKMAQGAKPGEGGELPGHKVSNYIAECRGTTPGVGLISPPPHHDIYSIEDLAQLIHDLKCANPEGTVSVKLVSEVGVGVVAAGVAKAKADHIVVSGGDGGTGAAAWTGIKAAGLPWELGVAETQQTLVLNGLRDRIRLQTDGQIKTARDVAIAAALGAEEYALSTGPLIALGCIMMRKCHLNTCPVGIATQDPELRRKFAGQPEHVINFFWLLAEDLREILLQLGKRSMDELIGSAGDVLEVDPNALRTLGRPDKTRGLDLAPLLQPGHELNPHAGVRHLTTQDHELDKKVDNELMAKASELIDQYAANPGSAVEGITIAHTTTNLDRTLGTMLSSLVSKKCGKPGLPDHSVKIELTGSSGQSLGFALAPGITIEVRGDANDGCGKGLSGGRIVVRPPDDSVAGFAAEKNVVVGNVACYGASSGEAFFSGVAGERFCVRNSGALAVVEGTGDHAAEYMTGGRIVILGETGRNFGAGMSGGVAFVYDPGHVFPERVNMGMVELGPVKTASDKAELKGYIEKHANYTQSTHAANILANYDAEVENFVRVMPVDYKKVLYPHGEEVDTAVAA